MNQDILNKLLKFREERKWGADHTPKNLAMAIQIEASELLKNWLWNAQYFDIDNCEDEIADIGIYLYYLCHRLKIDLDEAMIKKVKKNAKKYPI